MPQSLTGDPREAAVMPRVAWRLIPFSVIASSVSVIKQMNIGFTSLHVNNDLGLTQAAFELTGARFGSIILAKAGDDA